MTARSNRPEVRNPVLALPSAKALLALPPEVRELLAQLFGDVAADAQRRGDELWRKHKAPMAAYWKAKAVDARHIRRALRRARP